MNSTNNNNNDNNNEALMQALINVLADMRELEWLQNHTYNLFDLSANYVGSSSSSSSSSSSISGYNYGFDYGSGGFGSGYGSGYGSSGFNGGYGSSGFNGGSSELEQHSALLNQSLYERSPIIRVVSDELLEQLPRIKYTECHHPDQNRVCAITYEEFEDDSIIIQLQCNHCFFVEPIINWLSQNSCECPVCRFAMESVEKNNTIVHNVLSTEFTENNRSSVVNNVVVGTNNDGSAVDNSGIDIMLVLDN